MSTYLAAHKLIVLTYVAAKSVKEKSAKPFKKPLDCIVAIQFTLTPEIDSQTGYPLSSRSDYFT